MVSDDDDGTVKAIKDIIGRSFITHSEVSDSDASLRLESLISRIQGIRDRLSGRVPGMPDDDLIERHLKKIKDETIHTLLASGPWETLSVGGEEVDIDIFYGTDSQAAAAAVQALYQA
jgi:hypothetical protein